MQCSSPSLKTAAKETKWQTAKHVCLYFIRKTTQPGHYQFFLIPQKIPTQINLPKKNTCQFLYPNKSRNRKFQTQKNSFDHPCHLKSSLPPGALAPVGTHEIVRKKTPKKMCMNGYFIPHSALIFSLNICIFFAYFPLTVQLKRTLY